MNPHCGAHAHLLHVRTPLRTAYIDASRAGVAAHAIDKRSLRKQEAWRFISYLLNDKNVERAMITGEMEPVISDDDSLNASKWRAIIERELELQNSPDETMRPISTEIFFKSGKNGTGRLEEYALQYAASDTWMEAYLAGIQLELSNPLNVGFQLSSAFPDAPAFTMIDGLMAHFATAATKLHFEDVRLDTIMQPTDSWLPSYITGAMKSNVSNLVQIIRDAFGTRESKTALQARYRQLLGLATNVQLNESRRDAPGSSHYCPP